MNIKKFQAKSEEEAMNLAKKELGDGVVCLNVKSIKAKGFFSFFKKPVIEVTVATEDTSDTVNVDKKIAQAVSTVDKLRVKAEENNKVTESAQTSTANTNAVEKKLDNIQSLLELKLKKNDKPEEQPVKTVNENKVITEPAPSESDAHSTEIMNFVKILYNTMVENEIREQYANQMIDDIEQNFSKDMEMEYILSHIYQKMILKFGKSESITPAEKGPKIIYFIGPTGVGKTTTLAKIASQLKLAENKKIAMFTADTYRIAATNQLETYANIMGAPIEVIYTVEDMQEKFAKYSDYNYILVDTAGHSHHNDEQKENMNSFIHCLDGKAEKDVYLVLSATTKYKDLISIADTYSSLTSYKLIFTKLDETSTYGNLLNLRIHTGAPLSYVTCGQNVPDDLDKFDAQAIVKKLLISEQ